jgi:ketosteroid isomerase-like protein
MDRETDNIHTFNERIDAFKRRDISDMVMLVTDDVKINSIMFKTHKGKEGARKYWQELFNASPTSR